MPYVFDYLIVTNAPTSNFYLFWKLLKFSISQAFNQISHRFSSSSTDLPATCSICWSCSLVLFADDIKSPPLVDFKPLFMPDKSLFLFSTFQPASVEETKNLILSLSNLFVFQIRYLLLFLPFCLLLFWSVFVCFCSGRLFFSFFSK